MSDTEIIFCGDNVNFADERLVQFSNESNGGAAFRIPSLVNCGGTLVAVADRQTCGADWGYIELAVRRSEDGGETWSDLQIIASPPARATVYSDEYYASAFYIDPCMTVTPDGEILLAVDFFPECKGMHKKSLLDKNKLPYAVHEKKIYPTLFDRDGNFYLASPDGTVLNHKFRETNYTLGDNGALFNGGEYAGNIYLNGKSPSDVNEAGVSTTYGAPLKRPKRNYVYLFRSKDCGKTWSKGVDITSEFLIKSDGTFLGVAPGAGLATSNGRIVIPLYTPKGGTVSVYSIDGGEKWHRMTQQPYAQNIGEWQMVQAPDGTVLGLGRQNRYGKTPLSVSYDDGRHWENIGKTALYAPKCQKSVISVGDYVFCSHPSERTRDNGVITVGKFVRARGKTVGINWYAETPVNKGFFAYSCLTQIDGEHIGLLYEAQPCSLICFKKFRISELI